MSERVLLKTVGGPHPGTRIVDTSVMPWPLPDELPDPDSGGVYRKTTESQLPEMPSDGHVMRGAEYAWDDASTGLAALGLPDFISSECDSWHAAIAPTLDEAVVIFERHGFELDDFDEAPQRVMLARAQPPEGSEWEETGDYFEVNPQGNIVAWEVRV